MADDWILKVLSGTHLGAEVVLSGQGYILGRDESCDLVLDDVSLSDRHIGLRMEGGHAVLTLVDTERPVYVDDERLEDGSVVLKPFQLITIGALFLAVGPSDEPWPEIDLLLERKLKPGPPAETAPAAEETAGAPADAPPSGTAAAAPEVSSRKRPLAAGVAVIAVIALAAIMVLILLAGDLLAPGMVVDSRLTPEQTRDIEQLAAQYGATVRIEETAPGQRRIAGYIDTEGNRQRLRAGLAELGVRAELAIVPSEKIKQAMTAILDNKINQDARSQVEVTTPAGAPGDFVLKGYADDREAWEAALLDIRRNVLNYRSLKDEVRTRADLRDELRKLVAESFPGGVEVDESEHGLVLVSELEGKERKALKELAERFEAGFRPWVTVVVLEDGAAPSEASTVELDLHGISFGVSPHLIMKDGQRYGEGSQLDNGYVVDSITTEYVLLRRGEEVAYYYLAEVGSED